MGNAIAVGIDTRSFIKKLVNAGCSESQAEVHADTINKALTDFQDKNMESLATKSDLEVEIEKLELQLSAKINLIQWMTGFTLAAVMGIFIKLMLWH